MKFPLSAIALILPGILCAEQIRTINGTVYEDAVVTRMEPDGIVVQHKFGIVKISFAELGDEYKKRFRYDESAAQKFAAADAENQRALYERSQQAKQKEAAYNAEISERSAREAAAASDRKAISGFRLAANEVATANNSFDSWSTSWGSYDRSTVQGKTIKVAAHDVGGNSALCRIDVYFVAHSLTANVHFIYADQKGTLQVDRGIEASTRFSAPGLGSRILHLEALGEDYANGAQMEGWIAAGSINGQRFGLISSNQTVAKDAELLIAEFNARSLRSSDEPRQGD